MIRSAVRSVASMAAARWDRLATWRWVAFLPGLVMFLSTAALVMLGRFDGLYGQDPFAYYDYAVGPLRQSLLRLELPPPFYWPPGYPLLVTLASLVVGPVPLAGQLVSLIAGSLVPVFTVALAREVWEGRNALVPLVAGLVVGFTGQLWQSSVVVMADTAGLAAATLGVAALARYGRRGGARWLMLAVAALAWAVLSRWIYALVAVPCAVYGLLTLGHLDRRKAFLHGGAAVLVAGLILAPVLLPAVRALLNPTAGLAPFARDLQVYTWHPENALRREFITVDGLLRYRWPNGLYYALAPAHWFYFTPLLAPFILPGLWAALRRRTPALVWLILGWAAVVYAFHAGAPWQNFRFTLAYLPPLAVLVAIGVDRVRQVEGVGRPVGIFLAVGLVVMGAGGLRLTQGFIARKHADLALVRWVEAQVPADARLLTFGMTLTFRYYSRLETLELFELTPTEVTTLLADGRPTFLLLDVANVEAQWRGRAPDVNYRWLQEGPGLERLGAQRGYVLFRVGEGGNEPQIRADSR